MIRGLVCLAAVALLVLSGCGSSGPRLSHQEYEAAMQGVARDMNAKVAELERLASAPSGEAFAQVLKVASEALREGADRVGDINPPEEIDGAHHDLADALDEAADILGKVADRAEDGDVYGALQALDDAPDNVDRELREAITEIRAAGYYIGGEEDWG